MINARNARHAADGIEDRVQRTGIGFEFGVHAGSEVHVGAANFGYGRFRIVKRFESFLDASLYFVNVQATGVYSCLAQIFRYGRDTVIRAQSHHIISAAYGFIEMRK